MLHVDFPPLAALRCWPIGISTTTFPGRPPYIHIYIYIYEVCNLSLCIECVRMILLPEILPYSFRILPWPCVFTHVINSLQQLYHCIKTAINHTQQHWKAASVIPFVELPYPSVTTVFWHAARSFRSCFRVPSVLRDFLPCGHPLHATWKCNKMLLRMLYKRI